MVDGLRQRRTRLFGGQLEIRDEYHEVDRAVNRHTNVMHMAVLEQRHAEAAEDSGRGVIRGPPGGTPNTNTALRSSGSPSSMFAPMMPATVHAEGTIQGRGSAG